MDISEAKRHIGGEDMSQHRALALKFAGVPLSAWAFALRTWAAMMLALYVAFWLQLASASSAAVTVGILALPTRGQAYQKAIYRLLMTVVGVVASIVIAGLFTQSRDLFIIGFAGWLGLCVYACGFLDGNRAYGVVLAGYTVAIVAVAQIDSPQSIFLTGVDRGAAIAVGIVALALVNDVFLAPNVHTVLSAKLSAMHQRVRTFALAILRGESADPIQSANLLHEITTLRPDITALVAESSGGSVRAAAAASAAVALVAEVRAASALASLPARTSLREALGKALAEPLGEESRGGLQLRLQRYADVSNADPHDALLTGHGLELLIEDERVQSAIEDLQAGRRPQRRVRAPIYRSHRAAVRNGLRAFLAVAICAILFSLGGWPFASFGLAFVGTLVAFSALRPSPRMFVAAAVVGMPIAALLAGVTEFLILDGVDQFPLLAIGMAPSVIAAALLFTMPKPRLSSIGFVVLVFFPVILSPTNPQDYNPETYLYFSLMAITAVILLFALLRTVLPISDALLRRWYLTSAQAEMRDLLAGRRSRHSDDDALFRDADRVGQLGALQPADGDERRDDLRQALSIFGLAAAARRIQTALAQLSGRTDAHLLGEGYAALADCNAPRLREAAARLAASAATQLNRESKAAVRTATAGLNSAAFLIDTSAFGLRPNWSTSP
jgi:uncharacterized membrane protein YccC